MFLRNNIVLGVLCALLVVLGLEKLGRVSSFGDVRLRSERVGVEIEWRGFWGRPWLSAFQDPVNAGALLPGHQVKGYVDKTMYASTKVEEMRPVPGAAYRCENSLFSVSCKGRFWYSIAPRAFAAADPPDDWMWAEKDGEITVYKLPW